MLQGKLIDADGHILEPPDLWEKNLESKYQDRTIKMERDDEGFEYLIIDGKISEISRGLGGTAAGMGRPGEEIINPNFHYLDGPAGAYDPHARVKDLDKEGIDAAFLYPSLGLIWEDEVQDPGLAFAYARVYNDWLVDWCRPYPNRLIPVAHIPLIDMDRAVQELRRVVKKGMKGVMLTAHPVNKKAYGDRYYDPFWAEAQEMGVPVGIHVIVRSGFLGNEWYPNTALATAPFWYLAVISGFDVRAAFTSMFQGGVFERFPRLKVVVLEVGAGWLYHWLERMDSKWNHLGFGTGLKRPPSEYFNRQCWMTVDADETSIADTLQRCGEDKFFWSTDYPHFDAFTDAVKDVKENIKALPADTQQKLLGDNVARVYNL